MLSAFVESLFTVYSALRNLEPSLSYDSERFYDECRSCIRNSAWYLDDSDFKELLSAIQSSCDRSAAGAVAATLSAVYRSDKRNTEAKVLAELALGFNQNDLFPQRIMLGIEEERTDQGGALRDYLKGSFCARPFEHFETAVGGDVYVCCPSWLPRPIGNLADGSWEKIWGSDAALEIRESIIDGSFRYCSPRFCHPITERRLTERVSLTDQELADYREKSPSSAVFSHDLSCNLSCPSCRTEKISVGNSEQAQYTNLVNDTLMPLMEMCQEVGITGSGDPFGSIHFRGLIKEYCATHEGPRKIDLYTNAVLLDEKAWKWLKLSGNVRAITVSIDAATQETYKIVRRGGDFHRLLKNLEFLGNLRARGEFDWLSLAFVVQRTNYREMPAFVEMGRKFNADRVAFWNIRNWGTYSIGEFMEHAVAQDSHPDHELFKEVMADPLLADPICSLNDLSSFRETGQGLGH